MILLSCPCLVVSGHFLFHSAGVRCGGITLAFYNISPRNIRAQLMLQLYFFFAQNPGTQPAPSSLSCLTNFIHLWLFPSPDLRVGRRVVRSSPAPLLLLKVLQEPGYFKDSYCNLKEIWNDKRNAYKDAVKRILIIMIPNVIFDSLAEMLPGSPLQTFEFYFNF